MAGPQLVLVRPLNKENGMSQNTIFALKSSIAPEGGGKNGSRKLPPVLQDPVQRLLQHLDTAAPRTIVGLVGLPGAGKTTVAGHWGESMNLIMGQGTMMVLGMDGFHLSKAALKTLPDAEMAFKRRGAPWTFDTPAMAQRLQELRQEVNSTSIWWPEFEHDVGDPIEDANEIPPSVRLILVEGLYLLRQSEGWFKVRDHFDEFWYLDTPLEVALERLTLRHMRVWGISREEAKGRIAANDLLNAEIVLNSRTEADWLIEDP
jgi:pantothenate kinase